MKIMLDNLPESGIMISTVNKNNRIRLGGDLRSEQKIMKKHDIFKKIGLGLAISALAACQASAIVAYSNTGVAPNSSSGDVNGPYALGNDFTVNQAISVTAIGAFMSGGSSMAASVSVAIYNVTSGLIVIGTSVNLAVGTTGTGAANGSAFQNITPVTLGAGTYSIVAANYGGSSGAPYWYNANQGGTLPTFNTGSGLITMGGGRYTAQSSSLVFPGTTVGITPSVPTYGAGTFEFTAVPEVETFAIAGVSMLGLVFIGRNLVPRRSC